MPEDVFRLSQVARYWADCKRSFLATPFSVGVEVARMNASQISLKSFRWRFKRHEDLLVRVVRNAKAIPQQKLVVPLGPVIVEELLYVSIIHSMWDGRG